MGSAASYRSEMCCDEVSDHCQKSGKRKQNKQMEKFKELSIEEMQELF
ncbi:hypothetical protein [Algoriphagus faecimaris]|nr:hypothetical protein [Algoriphagus faecimaris]